MADKNEIKRKDYDLFFNGKIINFDDDTKSLDRELIEYKSSEPDLYHTVKQGDIITALANRYYGPVTENASRYWKYIADANNILNPLDLSGLIGQNIIIPKFNLIRLTE